jgi:hypothetical protein
MILLAIVSLWFLACQTITQPTVVNSVGEIEFAQLTVFEEELFLYEHQGRTERPQ